MKTDGASIANVNLMIRLKEMTAVYSEKQAKPINTLRVENSVIKYSKGSRSNH